MVTDLPFWKQKKLGEMSEQEWESLCDGCAQCCLHKLEDEDTGDIHYTRVACQLLNIETCRCRSYETRHELVPDCLSLRKEDIGKLEWLPETCAYRLRLEGKELPSWHPLVCGNKKEVHNAYHSVRFMAVDEKEVDDLEDYLL